MKQRRENIIMMRWRILLALLLTSLLGTAQNKAVSLKKGDRIAIIGNSLAERFQYDGWLETYLQAAYPNNDLTIRNLGYSGDQVHYRPRSHKGFGSADSHLKKVRASVILSFFGYNESFDDKPAEFKKQLIAWIDYSRKQKYDSISAPRLVLFSPIAHENLNSADFPDGKENNRRLEAYTKAMSEVAKQKGVGFVDLFSASKKLYETTDTPLTINGVHLNEEGNRLLSLYITQTALATKISMPKVQLDSLRSAVNDKDWHWFKIYRATSGNDVWGTRSIQDGNKATLGREIKMIEVMTANRDRRIWARAKGKDMEIDDSNVPDPLIVGTHITRDIVYTDPKEAIKQMTVPKDLQVNLFASEKEFPEIAKPVALQVDSKGQIWVAAWADYPKWEPKTKTRDRLVYLTDTNGDGVADKSTTFAYVSNPTGFEFWNNGVIVISAPDVLFLKDTNGDGVADYREVLFGGLGSDDTHHTANNLIFGPDGNIYYQRGIFILENIETPYRRSEESGTPGLYRFNPRTADFSFVVENTPNSHGISFDKWGNPFISDGTSGKVFHVYQERKVTSVTDISRFAKRPLFAPTVRPVTANALLSSSHFPETYHNNFLLLNVIGFQGIKRYTLDYKAEGVIEGKEAENFLFTGNDPAFTPNSEAAPRVIPAGYTGDPNFRPSDAVTGPDGALYFSDWQNAVITHSPYNLRDASRDQIHGRIYRVTAKDRPLLKPAAIAGEPIEKLLELFKSPEDEVRHRVRVELSGRDSKEVIQKAQIWANGLDAKKKEDVLPLLEVLWLHQQHNQKNGQLLKSLLTAPVEQARIAAQKVAWFWSDRPTHFVGSSGKEISGMEFRTFYEPFWKVPESAGASAHQMHQPATAATAVAKVESTKKLDLRNDPVAKLTIESIELKFSVSEFMVKPGQKVEMTLDNIDLMQHNVLIVEPGAADEVAQQAIELGENGPKKYYVPDSKKVLFASKLVDPKKKETLVFQAPDKPGDYQYVCTFPGHAPVMRGIMKVQ